MGSTPVGELGKSFFRVFDLRTRLHFIFLFLLGGGGGGGGGGRITSLDVLVQHMQK